MCASGRLGVVESGRQPTHRETGSRRRLVFTGRGNPALGQDALAPAAYGRPCRPRSRSATWRITSAVRSFVFGFLPCNEDHLVRAILDRISNPAPRTDYSDRVHQDIGPPATSAVIEASERAIGCAAHPLHGRLLQAVGNGGFRPGDGLIGLRETQRMPTGGPSWAPRGSPA